MLGEVYSAALITCMYIPLFTISLSTTLSVVTSWLGKTYPLKGKGARFLRLIFRSWCSWPSDRSSIFVACDPSISSMPFDGFCSSMALRFVRVMRSHPRPFPPHVVVLARLACDLFAATRPSDAFRPFSSLRFARPMRSHSLSSPPHVVLLLRLLCLHCYFGNVLLFSSRERLPRAPPRSPCVFVRFLASSARRLSSFLSPAACLLVQSTRES